MSWLQKQLPPKIKSTSEKKGVPEGLWVKCEGCDTVLYATDLDNNPCGSAPSAAFTTGSTRAPGSICCSIPKTGLKSAAKWCRSTA